MFSLWRHQISTVKIIINATALGMPKIQIHAIDAALAINADSDEMRARSAVANHVKQAAMPAGQNSANRMPKNVATPFRP